MTIYQSYEEAIEAGAKGTDTITEPCGRCFGTGDIGYGTVEVFDVRVGAGVVTDDCVLWARGTSWEDNCEAMTESGEPRCPFCIHHPGWATGNEAARHGTRDVCRKCLGSGVDLRHRERHAR